MKKVFTLSPEQTAEAIVSHYTETTGKIVSDNGQALLAEYIEDDEKMIEAIGNWLTDNDKLEEDTEVFLQYKVCGVSLQVEATEFEGTIN